VEIHSDFSSNPDALGREKQENKNATMIKELILFTS
jgi:hypothetical protein